MKFTRFVSARRALLVLVVASVGACGGGDGDGDDAASVLATRLLGSEVTDETRDDHDCVAASINDAVDDEQLAVLASAASLDDLDLPSREQLLQAALRCVSVSQLAG